MNSGVSVVAVLSIIVRAFGNQAYNIDDYAINVTVMSGRMAILPCSVEFLGGHKVRSGRMAILPCSVEFLGGHKVRSGRMAILPCSVEFLGGHKVKSGRMAILPCSVEFHGGHKVRSCLCHEPMFKSTCCLSNVF
ncbi:uncharacterized protein LOC128229393 [Mya arenaria]|uniref:uncharacterized protein LOC128229393 n=1 Tax=Mya arenaria TaxID=6604 RepID=UPI0022E96A7E|nr:uncharacterized protein LOC128229393 [Mya arenaria]